MNQAIIIIANVMILGLFLYSKLLPYKDKLIHPYKGIFDFFNKIFSPVLDLLKRFISPFQVGRGLAVDMNQVVLLLIFLFLINKF